VKALVGYRTYLVSGLAGLVGIASFILAVAGNMGPLDAQTSGGVIVVAILMAVLRTVTKTPPLQSAPAAPTVTPPPPAA
jgi:hypothetical protein